MNMRRGVGVALVASGVASIAIGLLEMKRAPALGGKMLILGGTSFLTWVARPFLIRHQGQDALRAVLLAGFLIATIVLLQRALWAREHGDTPLAVGAAIGAAAGVYVVLGGALTVLGGVAERRGRRGWIVRFARRHRSGRAQ